MFGVVLVEVCDANPACTPELFELEQEFPGLSILETSCLSTCELCAERPYVMLDGEIVASSDAHALVDLLRARLAERFRAS